MFFGNNGYAKSEKQGKFHEIKWSANLKHGIAYFNSKFQTLLFFLFLFASCLYLRKII
jgi:hypothetical protein